MGDENKIITGPDGEEEITDLAIRQSKDMFLPPDLQDPDFQAIRYSLKDEFAASAKNKSPTFYLVIASFLLALIGGTFLSAQFIEWRYRRADVKISEFKDINLASLLEATRD